MKIVNKCFFSLLHLAESERPIVENIKHLFQIYGTSVPDSPNTLLPNHLVDVVKNT